MFTNETFLNTLIDDVLLARVLCCAVLFYSYISPREAGTSALVASLLFAVDTIRQTFLLLFFVLLSFRVGHSNFMRI